MSKKQRSNFELVKGIFEEQLVSRNSTKPQIIVNNLYSIKLNMWKYCKTLKENTLVCLVKCVD